MIDFLLFCTATAGMTLIIVRGTIFQGLREWIASHVPTPSHVSPSSDIPLMPIALTPAQKRWQKVTSLFFCCQCMGFWCGLLCGTWYVFHDAEYTHVKLVEVFLCGCAGSFCSLFADIVLDHLHRSRR